MISIAMATYNGAKYLREQLDSLFNQTIQDFELVVCDDCSTDNTWQILESYATNNSKMRIVENDKNLGFKGNFEKAIRLCEGDYIALCDQDDIWLPDHLSVLLDAMDDEIQIVCGECFFVDEYGQDLGFKHGYLYGLDYKPTNSMDIARHIFLNIGSVQGTAMLIKRDFFNWALPIPKETVYHDCWFAAIACFTGGFKFLETPVLKYRRHSGEVTIDHKRQSPMRAFLGRTLVNHQGSDRIVFVREIRQRVTSLSIEHRELLDMFDKMLKRRKSLIGRLRNVPYLLEYFKPIFGFDGKHLFR